MVDAPGGETRSRTFAVEGCVAASAAYRAVSRYVPAGRAGSVQVPARAGSRGTSATEMSSRNTSTGPAYAMARPSLLRTLIPTVVGYPVQPAGTDSVVVVGTRDARVPVATVGDRLWTRTVA